MASLIAQKREDLTKSNTKRLRNEGFIPGIVYGKKEEPKTIAVDNIAFQKLIREEGRNAVLSLEIENESPLNVMLQEYQADPIRDELIHVDFYVVDMSEEMDVEVAIRTEGEDKVAKSGGVLQQTLYELQVRGKPGSFPEEIVVDVSELEIGDSITVADLPTTDKYSVLNEPDETVATVIAPDKVEDTEVSADDENAEPELVDDKKDQEE